MAHFYSEDSPYKHGDQIEGVIFDLDGTLYPNTPAVRDLQMETAVIAVQNQLPGWREDDIREMIELSRAEYGGSLNIFALDYGADIDKLRRDQFANMITKTEDGFFDAKGAPHEQLTRLQYDNVSMAIATHGSHDWTAHTLDKLDIDQHFSTARHITKGDVDNIGKNVGADMYHATLNAMGVSKDLPAEERGVGFAMIEDSMKNLKRAKELGMMTVLIDPDGEHDEESVEDYVDVVVDSVAQGIDCIIESNTSHAPDQGLDDTPAPA